MSTHDTSPAPTSPSPAAELPQTVSDSPAASPAAEATPPPAPRPADDGARPGRPRTGTMVWGLVLLLIGAAVTAVGVGATLDLQAVLIGLLLVAGAALLVGAILSARRPGR